MPRAILIMLVCAALTGWLHPAPPQQTAPAWSSENLIGLDELDAPAPQQDIAALMARRVGDQLELRIDWLEVDYAAAVDIRIALDTRPGGPGDGWDTIISLPAYGPLTVQDAQGRPTKGAALFLQRDALQDSSLVRLRLPPWPGYAGRVMVEARAPGRVEIADRTAALPMNGRPAPPIPVLVGFTLAYPAYTPITALRRWSGAHTGPFGGSHGLHYLLQGARRTATPIAFLDSFHPKQLAALDYAGALPLLQSLAQQNLLMLPRPTPTLEAALPALERSQTQQALRAFGLAQAQTSLPAARSAPAQAVDQLDINGLSLPARIAILAALNRPGAQPVQLGGSLPESAWGVPHLAEAGFNYIKAHPWMRVLGPHTAAQPMLFSAPRARLTGQPAAEPLSQPPPIFTWGPHQRTSGARAEAVAQAPALTANLPGRPALPAYAAGPVAPGPLPTAPPGASTNPPPEPQFAAALPPDVRQALSAAFARTPNNPLKRAAGQAYLSLSAPVFPPSPDLPRLRAAYAPLVFTLLEAAAWADAPVVQQLCTPNHSRPAAGLPGCTWANARFFLHFHPSGGLNLAFWKGTNGVHQFVGPSAQLITGLSEPSGWRTPGGEWADPGDISGALDGPGPAQAFFTSDGIVFTEGQANISYRIMEDQLIIQHHAHPNSQARHVPLLLDPWLLDAPGWAGRYKTVSSAPNSWLWEVQGAVSVSLHAQAAQWASFTDLQPYFTRSEDPNRDYPAGRILPFPMAVLSLPPVQSTILTLSLAPSDILDPVRP